MVLIVGFIHKLTHLADIVVHLKSVASQYDKSDPGPSQSDHAPIELLFTHRQLSHLLEMLTIVFEDLGENLESIEVLKGSQSVQK